MTSCKLVISEASIRLVYLLYRKWF